MSGSRKETDPGRIFQLTFGGRRVEVKPGSSLEKIYEELRRQFSPEHFRRETIYLKHEDGGKTEAVLIWGSDDSIERILVIGVTSEGYLVSPQVLFEKRAGEFPQTLEVNLSGRREFSSQFLNLGRIIGFPRDDLERIEVRGHPNLSYDLVVVKPASLEKSKKLFEEWGVLPLKTFPFFLRGS